jgi:hypothetical protein
VYEIDKSRLPAADKYLLEVRVRDMCGNEGVLSAEF